MCKTRRPYTGKEHAFIRITLRTAHIIHPRQAILQAPCFLFVLERPLPICLGFTCSGRSQCNSFYTEDRNASGLTLDTSTYAGTGTGAAGGSDFGGSTDPSMDTQTHTDVAQRLCVAECSSTRPKAPKNTGKSPRRYTAKRDAQTQVQRHTGTLVNALAQADGRTQRHKHLMFNVQYLIHYSSQPLAED